MSENQRIRNLERMVMLLNQKTEDIAILGAGLKSLGEVIKELNHRIGALERRVNAAPAATAAPAPEMVASTGVNSLKIKY